MLTLYLCDSPATPHFTLYFYLTPHLTFQDTHSKEAAIEKLHHGVLWLLALPDNNKQKKKVALMNIKARVVYRSHLCLSYM